MSKQMIVCASIETKKYYFNPDFNDMPESIKEEIKEESIKMSQKVQGIIAIGFNDDGNIYIEEQRKDVFVDTIGVELEIRNFQKEKQELLKSLKTWYMIYRTQNGKIVREILIKQAEGLTDDEIIEAIQENFGDESAEIAQSLLD